MPIDRNYISHLLVRIAQHNDRKAFESLFQAYYERLFHFSMNFVHSKDLAEEVVSDVFVKVWRNRVKLSSIRNIDTYLYIATKHQSINYVQKYSLQLATTTSDFDPDKLIEWFNPEKELEYRELLHDIHLAVENLPHQCKVIFKLIREDGLKYQEVAEILSISVRTVETQLFRAIKKLSIALDAHIAKKRSLKKTTSTFVSPLWLLSYFFYHGL